MSTPDHAVAEKIGRAVDGQIFRLQEERAMLLKAQERIAEIDAEIAVLLTEKTRIDQRRPPRPDITERPVDAPARNPRE